MQPIKLNMDPYHRQKSGKVLWWIFITMLHTGDEAGWGWGVVRGDTVKHLAVSLENIVKFFFEAKDKPMHAARFDFAPN